MSRKQEHKIELSNAQRSELYKIANSESKKLSQATKKRAKVIMHLDELGENPISANLRKKFTKKPKKVHKYQKIG